MSVKIKVDFRDVLPKIQRYAESKVRSVNESPDIKTNIYTDIYYSLLQGKVPIDTGALDASPEGGASFPKHRFANGGIDSEGIHYDPYQVSVKTGAEHHYGDAILSGSDSPNWIMTENKDAVTEIVKKYVIEQMKG